MNMPVNLSAQQQQLLAQLGLQGTTWGPANAWNPAQGQQQGGPTHGVIGAPGVLGQQQLAAASNVNASPAAAGGQGSLQVGEQSFAGRVF